MSYVPILDAAIIARTDASTVRRWARLNLLLTDTADDGSPLYEVAGLMHLERELRHHKIRHAYANLARYLTDSA